MQIKKKGLTLEDIEEGIKRARDIKVKADYEVVFNDEFARNKNKVLSCRNKLKNSKIP